MRRLKHIPIPSGSLIIALLALFVVLGSSAVAASLVTSKQIQDGTIQAKDISKKARASFSGKPGPAGPQGTQGPQGVQGPKGDMGAAGKDGANGVDAFGTLKYVRNTCSVPEGTQGACTATCPDGLRPVGGGAGGHAGYSEHMEVNASQPSPADANATGWTGWFDNNPDTGATGSDLVSAYAVCASATNVSNTAVTG
jgi:hypothetical protein